LRPLQGPARSFFVAQCRELGVELRKGAATVYNGQQEQVAERNGKGEIMEANTMMEYTTGIDSIPPSQLALWKSYQEEGFGYVRPKRGDFTTGTIMEVSPQALWVDIGVKQDGLVPAHDLRRLGEQALDALEVGDEVPVFVVRPRDREGRPILSLSRGKELEKWKEAQRLLDSGDIVHLEVQEANKGGVVVAFGGLRGFVPASHLESVPRGLSGEERRSALDGQIGEVLPLKVLEIDRRRRRLVLSHRRAVGQHREQRKQELLQTLQVGDVRSGRVTALRPFGAFVDVGGADGLVHVSEIAHRHIGHPRQALEVGQEVDVYVLRLDQERKRIGLSIKRLLPDPWPGFQSRHYPGQLVEGTITHVVDYGAFAEIEQGIEGLIHVSQMSREFVEDPRDVVSPGDHVALRILNIDPERRRVSLNLKDAPQWVEEDPSEPEKGSFDADHDNEGAGPSIVAESPVSDMAFAMDQALRSPV
jgi:small subunit ribosomal protein S1